MQRLRMVFVAGASLMAASVGAGAQLRTQARIPAGYEPPAGMCRVWFQGVAPARQPAPTDCASARANLRPTSRLIQGATRRTRTNGLRTSDGTYDPRNGNDPRNGTYDSRNGTYDGRYDRVSDEQRREMDRERRKRDKEWKHNRRNGDNDDEDNDDNDDGDDDGNNNDGNHHGNRGNNHDNNRNRDRDNRSNGGIYNGRSSGTGTWGRNGVPAGPCVDVNRDGICDNTQQGAGRVRIP